MTDLVVRTRLTLKSGAGTYCNYGTSTFWYPVAPGTTSLPAPPAATVNANPLPPNAVAIPEDFDPTDLCYLFQDLLPVNQPAVFADELTPAINYQPFTETVPMEGVVVTALGITEYPYSLTLPTGALDAEVKAALSYIIPLPAAAASFTLTGQDAAKRQGYRVIGAAGSFALTGQAADLRRPDLIFPADAGAFTLSGQDAQIPWQRLPFQADAASFALTGQDADLWELLALPADTGTFVMTGEDATFARPDRVVVADAGTFALSGQSATLTYTSLAAGKIVTYTGNASTQSITGAGFKPGLVFIARESAASDVYVFDKVTAATKYWNWDRANALTTNANTLTTFDTDGFSLGNSSVTNGNTLTFVSFLVKETGTASTNNNGTITTTVSADDTMGYSVFTYSGNATDNATIGHGLSASPELVIIKQTNTTSFGTNFGRMGGTLIGANDFLFINTTAAKATDSSTFQAFSSTTIQLGTVAGMNFGTGEYVGYAFRSTDSIKCGTYSSNGAGVYSINLGWRPAFFLIKVISGTTGNWLMFYRTASGDGDSNYNTFDSTSATPSSTTYKTTSTGIEIPINGFGNSNGTSNTALYLAFRG